MWRYEYTKDTQTDEREELVGGQRHLGLLQEEELESIPAQMLGL